MQKNDYLILSEYDYNFTRWYLDNEDFLKNLYRFFHNKLKYYSGKINNYTLFDKGNRYIFTKFIYESNKNI
jgi:hypothetical protein